MGAASDDERFRVLYESTYTGLHAYARRRCSHRPDADDLVAEVYAIAWRRRDDLPDGDDGRLYLYGIARNVRRMQARARRRQAGLVARLRGEASADAPEPPSADPRVSTALAGLAEGDRELLRLIAWDELTVAQAAVVLGVSTASAESRLRRARARLRRRLDDLGVERTSVKGGDR